MSLCRLTALLVPLATLALVHPAAASDPPSRGDELFVALRCGACHAPGAARAERLPVHPAPRLDDAGGRLRPEWLRRFLAAPAEAQPGARMPDLLAGLEASERAAAVEDLVAFLASRGGPPAAVAPPSVLEVEGGRQLYHSVGCIVCHDPLDFAGDLDWPLWRFADGFDEGVAPPPATGRSLLHLAAKTSAAPLAALLRDPRHVLPDGRMPSLALSEAEARRIAAYLTTPGLGAGRVGFERTPGLMVEYFEAELDDERATYDAHEPVRLGVVDTIDGLPEHRDELFGFRFTGFVEVPRAGSYTFYTTSDDGSRLYVDEQLVVDNAGDHGMVERSGEVELEAGSHALLVTMYERHGGEGLEVAWSGPELERRALDTAALSHWTAQVAPASAQPAPTAARIAAGQRRFAALGCAACHPLDGLQAPVAPPLDALDPAGGCLDPAAVQPLPRYELAADERAALAAFVRDRAERDAPLAPAEALRRTLVRLDCYACHQRDGVGGPDPALVPYFRVDSDLDLGDEGRLPPHLDGVGAKLRLDWLERVLLEGAGARPYVTTRMPDFGRDHVGQLPALFHAVDDRPGADLAPAFSVAAVEDGRRLASVGALGCIQCHDFGPYPSLGIPAVDLLQTHERIRPGWFRRLLLEPRSVGLSTRMPLFWQDGESPVADVLDGDPARQTDALWTWLSLGGAAPLPEGLLVPDATYELMPLERPVLCGVFMKGVGPRTLVVGFPERLHYAFDMGRSRLALAWRGRFFNARGTWHARAGALESPPSDDVLELPPGPAFALLASPDAAWPGGASTGYRALGRRLDSSGRPVLRYALRSVEIEELPFPVLGAGGGRLVRRFRVSGAQRGDVYLRVAAGAPPERVGDARWRVGATQLALSLPAGAQALARASELLVRLPPVAVAELEVELSW